MRPRFSLRAFFVFATLVALVCAWCVLPTIAAKQFVRALANGNYKAADDMFVKSKDRCLEQWDEKHWSFHASGRLEPLTIGQLIRGQRLVQFNLNYFALDQTVNRNGLLAVTPLGAKAPEVGPERYGSLILDGTHDGIPNMTR
jgi:hypothetical protein